MPDCCLDTSVLVAYFKNEDVRTVEIVERIVAGENTAVVSAITVAEIVASSEMNDPALREKRLAVLGFFDVVLIDRGVAERGGELRRQHNLALPDALIAACAEKSGGRFLSKDTHYNRLLNANVLTGEVYE